MLDGMSDSIQGSRIENLQSREVDRQSPTGLILFYFIPFLNFFFSILSLCSIFKLSVFPLYSVYSLSLSLSPLKRPFSRWTQVSRCSLKQRMMEAVVTTGAISRAKLQSNHHPQQTNTLCLTNKGSWMHLGGGPQSLSSALWLQYPQISP